MLAKHQSSLVEIRAEFEGRNAGLEMGYKLKVEELRLVIEERDRRIEDLQLRLELLEQTKTPEHLQLLEMQKRFQVEIEILKRSQSRELKDFKAMLDA